MHFRVDLSFLQAIPGTKCSLVAMQDVFSIEWAARLQSGQGELHISKVLDKEVDR